MQIKVCIIKIFPKTAPFCTLVIFSNKAPKIVNVPLKNTKLGSKQRIFVLNERDFV